MKNHTWPEKKFLGIGTVGERGQVAIPSEAKKFCNVQAGDKLAFFSIGEMGFTVIKTDQLNAIFDRFEQESSDIRKQVRKEMEE
jgi:bifunctional DNA-binding transcriptional regulator/antitoxin component of YhaV-PrlF toxin-antitoxin module